MNTDASETFDPPPRIVRPRARQHKKLPIVAIHGQETLTENGEMGKLADLVATLPELEPTLFVKYMGADFLAGLDAKFANLPNWQWHVTERERVITRPDGVRAGARVTTVVHFFGFKKGNYHKMIDPVTMTARSLDDVWPSDKPKIVRLMEWAVTLRDFCDENNMEVRPTTGGISAQFLTDPRFYPHARRKVPKLTNNSVRERLPGNFYYLSVRPGPKREYTAYYIDQHRAHHYHAQNTPLPHADGLYAMGDFQNFDTVMFPEVWDDFYGLYCLDLNTPKQRRTSSYVREWLKHGIMDEVLEKRFVYSNEIQFLRDMGYTVRGVRAAWGSHRQDEGLAKYAEWAMEQLDRYGSAPWIKPLLLSTYGTLATRPKIAETVWKQSKRGEPVTLATGQNKLHGMLTKGRTKIEPRIANVLHRGMIEAATRVESISYAYYLTSKNHRILSIYADAIIVQVDDDDPDLPLIVDPWRMKDTLNHLQFINTQSFQSGEMTRMPGVPGISKDAARHRQASPGRAPRILEKYEALTGRLIRVDTRTGIEVK